MKAIILAAGMGRRLKPITDKVPKCLVEVKGKPLLVLQLDALVDCGINKVVLVVGYKKELIQKFIGNSYRGMQIEYVINDDYATTNNIYSLWLAKDHLYDDDVLLLECDVIFEKELIFRLIEEEKDAVIAVDRFRLGMDGTVVEVNHEGIIRQLLTRSEQNSKFDFSKTYKTINVYKFSKRFLTNVFVPSLDLYVKSRGVTSYYELVLAVLIYLKSPTMKAMVVDGLRWYEIDDENDLQKAEYLLGSPEEKLKIIKKLYGGYWCHNFTDFCYLPNPYFPTDSMIAEMKYQLHDLISNYPSGQEELDKRISRMFHIAPKNIVVANGSSQLIQIFDKSIARKAPIVIPLPTFNEYERTLEKDQIIPYYTEKSRFNLRLQDYASFIRAHNVRYALLINPDNPTGWAVKKNDLVGFLDSIQSDIEFFVVDESFTDFVDGVGKNTLLRQEIMEKYPFLVIIRSLSKEFGIAGLRLGFLASGNDELVDSIKKELPIWNINSLAECFMELFLKYRDEYEAACQKVIKNRNALYNGLKEVSFLKPYPSFANFVFCEVVGKLTASSLQDKLFLDHNIFIKDCSNKSGLKPNKYIRVASRTPFDNKRLLDILCDIGR